MRLLFFGDLHAADNPPSGRVDDYRQTVLDKLATIGELCRVYRVDYALSTGDVFHLKQPSRVSHSLVQALITAFRRFPCPVLAIPGNHDLGPDGVESLSRQPLGTLERAGALEIPLEMRLLYVEGRIDSQVWLVPHPYSAAAEGVFGQVDPTYYSVRSDEVKRIMKDVRPVIGLAHGSLLAPGDKRPYPYVTVDQIPNFHLYSLFVSGHLHETLGVVPVRLPDHEPGKHTLFANPGSVLRTSRSLMNYSRQVEVLIVSILEGGVLEVEEVPLPEVAPAKDVFAGRALDEHHPELATDEIDQFLSRVGEGLRADQYSIDELIASCGGDVPVEIKSELKRLLEEAQS